MASILLGCSGWDYDDWTGVLYRPGERSKLAAYSAVFDTAEINSTFYRMADPGLVQGWKRNTPDRFRFSAKVPQLITHEKRLKDCQPEVRKFEELMRPLMDCGKLCALLIQLPPRLKFDPVVADRFYSMLSPDFAYACEFRNQSWLCKESIESLRTHGAAYVAVDEPLLPPDVHVTSDLAYFRWHGRGDRPWYNYRYSKEEMLAWVPKVKEAAKKAKNIIGYFNNHYHGYGPENCIEMLDLIGEIRHDQRAKLEQMHDSRQKGKKPPDRAPKQGTLDSFSTGDGAGVVEELLVQVASADAIEDAKRIRADRLALSKVSGPELRGDVDGTRIVIDAKNRRVRHDCASFRNGVVCRHICCFFLRIPDSTAADVLRDLVRNRALWTFGSYWRNPSILMIS